MNICDVAKVIKDNDNFALAVHVNPDGDCIGSASALLLTLRSMGKRAHTVLDGTVPQRLAFLAEDGFLGNADGGYDVCIAVDVASDYMMGSVYESTFKHAKVTCCLDHHGTNKGYADINCIDPDASAAGEVVYDLIENHLGGVSPDAAMRLYAAIASDTGSFRYSNTTARTHLIASKLLEKDFDAPLVMRLLFEVKTVNQLRLKSDVINGLKFELGGKVCIAVLEQCTLDKYGMTFEDADDLASLPRSLDGVEVGVFIKVKAPNEVKVSLRSNAYADVAQIAASLGGGGHIRAAGVTIKADRVTAEKMILEELKKVM